MGPMLRHNRLNNSSLEYLRPSPVRGQLEPQDPKTAKGWRYLQTTDTLDELKVLLPPHTASMYSQLLKLEELELMKKTVSWQRVVEMRHLKERMIRKCKRLSPRPVGQFTSVVAASDFRLKEMEKWFKAQQIRISGQRPTDRGHAVSASGSMDHCCTTNHRHAHVKSKGFQSASNDALPPILTDSPEPMMPSPSPSPPKAFSPEPLPHLLRISSLSPKKETNTTAETSRGDATTTTTPLQAETRPKLRRQRSCIKRSNTGDSIKTVSWADDRDLTERAGEMTQEEAQRTDDWEDMQQVLGEHMERLQQLETQVQASLQRLQIESETLQGVCIDIRSQKDNLREVIGRISRKQQLDYRAKVQEVLNEADGLLSLYGNKEVHRPRFMPIIDEDSREEPVEPVIE